MLASEKTTKLVKILSTMLTLTDMITDVIVIVDWYHDNHTNWFIFGLVIILISDLVEGYIFGYEVGFLSGAIHFSGFGALYELIIWWSDGAVYEQNFSTTKLIEAFFEAGPFLLLQTYVVVIEGNYTHFSIGALIVSCSSVSYAAALEIEDFKLELKIKNLVFNSSIMVVRMTDVIFRTFSTALLLKVVTSIVWRSYIAAFFVITYGYLAYMQTNNVIERFMIFISYPLMTVEHLVFETIGRYFAIIGIAIFVYTKDVIRVEGLAVSVTIAVFFIVGSCWRLAVDDEQKKYRDRATNLLSCCCRRIPLACKCFDREHPSRDNASTEEL